MQTPYVLPAIKLLCALQECAPMAPEKVRMVHGVDGRATGEAYVHISGEGARLRFALAKDRMLMPVSRHCGTL